jgi:hypothetical protein
MTSPELPTPRDQEVNSSRPKDPTVESSTMIRRHNSLERLLVRKMRWSLTLEGKLLVTGAFLTLTSVLVLNLNPFLSLTSRVPSETLVVDGWMPTYDLERAANEYKSGNYRSVLVVRGVYEFDAIGLDRPWDDYVADILVRCGVPHERLNSVLFAGLKRDRTYTSALAIKKWFEQNSMQLSAINVVTTGPHARRSRLLYRIALGNKVDVGVIGLDEPSYDSTHWWRTSEGIREVLSETLAYIYAKLIFSPGSQPAVELLRSRPR